MNAHRTEMRVGQPALAVAGVFLSLLIIAVFQPNYVNKDRSRSYNAIINNLLQIDGAKEQWALDNEVTGPVEITREQLSPYLRDRWVSPVADELYYINPIGVPPTAELTRQVGSGPKGAVVSLP